MTLANNKNRISPINNNQFMQAFLRNKSLRPSCYDCVCKETDGVADITLGDAWGIENYCKKLDDNKGTSIVFVRSQKGIELFKNISEKIDFFEAESFEKALSYNSAMCFSVPSPSDRDAFFSDLNKGVRFDRLTKKYCSTSITIRAKRMVKTVLRMNKKAK